MIQKHINLLGYKCKDRVTGFKGVITSISFDLYGCVQAVVVPEVSGDGSKGDGHWFDVSRLKITSKSPVMPLPDFAGTGPIAEGKKGPAEKPAM